MIIEPLGHPILSGFWLAQLADITIVAIVARAVIRSIWRTPAMSIVLVFLGVLVSGIVLRDLQFFTVGYLLESLSGVLFITSVVIFHEDIRNILLEQGRKLSARLRSRPALTGRETVEAIVSSCVVLRRRKLGAIIVIERNDLLDNYYREGLELDNLRVVPEVVASMLQPPGPLHDGALVIRNDRLVRASTFLPLAEYTRFKLKLGARHRAALGLAERSDAVVVIVSEESGDFRIAHDGLLDGPHSEEVLREELLSLTGNA
ncbi:MAG: diadenylate cyclase [Candidatus Fermentibacter sp.]|nr:diadenylate cyclase [Candidatus Fermentibacter sp.]